ncbi:hypothetical protein I4U23_005252 [Adineta vaga]|nr:hypothetical protein I4U23_005252 [Adineta vaga]
MTKYDESFLTDENPFSNNLLRECLNTTKSEFIEPIDNYVCIIWLTNDNTKQNESLHGRNIIIYYSNDALIDFIIITISKKFNLQILNNTTELFRLIIEDIEVCTKDLTSVSILDPLPIEESTNQSKTTSFTWYYLLIESLFDLSICNQTSINDLITYCRQQYSNENISQQDVISDFERTYLPRNAGEGVGVVKYFVRSFTLYMTEKKYQTTAATPQCTNKRNEQWTQEWPKVKGVFTEIESICKALKKTVQDCDQNNISMSFVPFSGGIKNNNLDQLDQSFITNRQVSLSFARQTMETSDMMGILFVMNIDSSIPSTPFANVRNVSCFEGEEEILFSMHSVFRIEQIEQMDGNNRLWQVNLTLTNDNDPQLRSLTERIRQEIFPHLTGWYRLGNLLIKIGQFNKAQQIFEIMLGQTTNEHDKANIYHMLGLTTLSGMTV